MGRTVGHYRIVAERGQAKLLDFGLAKVAPELVPTTSDDIHGDETLARPEQLTMPGVTLGTLDYMSPEQLWGKDEDVRLIGRRLDVATVLEGSIRKNGRRVRISAQLVVTSDGFTIWSHTYDRELDDIFAVQDDIARSVSGALQLKLLGRTEASTARPEPNAEAFNLYLQGRYLAARRTPKDLEQAISYSQQALEVDPDDALAWVGLADAHGNLADLGALPIDEGYRQAREEVEKEKVPFWRLYGLALAYHALGRSREADSALRELVARHSDDGAFQIAGVYAFRGDLDDAFSWLDRAYAQRDGGFNELKGDPLLSSLTRDPRYAALLAKLTLPA